MKNNIIVFATFWNEIDWAEASLEQLDILDPCEIIICDGCFDSRFPVHSTDGTKQVIEQYTAERAHASMISPVRTNRWNGLLRILQGHGKGRFANAFSPARFKAMVAGLLFNQYRLNQALTFQKMIRLSNAWKPGLWFMTYDADQFYSHKVLENIRNINNHTNYCFLSANEFTFFENFKAYTDEYESRHFNNMPHKILDGTNIMPTRDIILEDFSLKSFGLRNLMKSDRYIYKCSSAHVGWYCHYKFRPSCERTRQGYMLGDRKAPNAHLYTMKMFNRDHPDPVKKLIEQWK